MTWRKYPNLRAWIVGRIFFAPLAGPVGLSPQQLEKPPAYLCAFPNEVPQALRALRDDGVLLFAVSRRWYIRDYKKAKLIGRPIKAKRKPKA